MASNQKLMREQISDHIYQDKSKVSCSCPIKEGMVPVPYPQDFKRNLCKGTFIDHTCSSYFDIVSVDLNRNIAAAQQAVLDNQKILQDLSTMVNNDRVKVEPLTPSQGEKSI